MYYKKYDGKKYVMQINICLSEVSKGINCGTFM